MDSKLILGTAQFGLNYGVNNTIGKPTKKEVINLLDEAYNSGIRFLDTAEAYGNVHELIGDYHKIKNNFNFKIISKFQTNIDHNSIKNKVLEYINLMNINILDIIMFHSFESYISNYKAINILKQLKLDGLINHIGVSVYTNAQLEILLNDDLIEVIQLPFNLLDNYNIRGNLINKLKIKGKIIHTRSAFLQGLFFKKTSDEISVVKALKPYLKKINKITYEYNCSIEELALSYCISHKNIDNVIIGVDSINQFKSNIKASTFKLNKKIKRSIDNIVVENLELLNPSLWR